MLLAACGSATSSLGHGSYHHKASLPPVAKTVPKPTAPKPVPTPSTPTTTAPVQRPAPVPSYLHPPPGEPWTVRGSAPWVAAQYVQAIDQLTWKWSTPAQYLYDARPYMTKAYYDLLDSIEQRALAAHPTPETAVYWHQVKTEKLGYYIEVAWSYTIIEAGVTPTTQTVRVAFRRGNVFGGVSEPIATTHVLSIVDLSMQKVDGRWEVARVQSRTAG
ncbi:MAG: hypothetical protein M0Z95_21775 [Actinomycetota bacterium]|nr:hypothetical protein [Actinomycetota bacterium]